MADSVALYMFQVMVLHLGTLLGLCVPCQVILEMYCRLIT